MTEARPGAKLALAHAALWLITLVEAAIALFFLLMNLDHWWTMYSNPLLDISIWMVPASGFVCFILKVMEHKHANIALMFQPLFLILFFLSA